MSDTQTATGEKRLSLDRSNVIVVSLRAALLAIMGYLLWGIAWMSDDAMITLRHGLNLTRGWGPGYNATESVQAYTHPLWFLMWSGVGWLTGEWLVTITVLSILLTLGAVALILWRTKSLALIFITVGVLTLSNAFIEFAVSGLENPLSYFSVGMTLLLALGARPANNLQRGAFLGLAVAALSLTRLDLLLVVAPVLLWWLWTNRKNVKMVAFSGVAFLVPFTAWHAWAYSTYGSLPPNTYTAKRNVDIPALELLERGLRYIALSFSADVFTALAVLGGLTVVFFLGSQKLKIASIGVVLYIAYVVYIGGDFMAGRFLAVPVYASVLLFVLALREQTFEWLSYKADTVDGWVTALLIIPILSVVFILANISGIPPTATHQPVAERWPWETRHGIADERGYYLNQRMAIKYLFAGEDPPDTAFSIRKLQDGIRRYEENAGGERVTLPLRVEQTSINCGGLGYESIVFDGPKVHRVDTCGLSDAFIAGLPYQYDSLPYQTLNGPVESFSWRAGHFDREIPEGYLDAIQKNDPSLVRNPELAEQLRKLWGNIR